MIESSGNNRSMGIKTSAQKKKDEQDKIIRLDMAKIDSVLETGTVDELIVLHRELDGKYQSCIMNWGLGMNDYYANGGFLYDYLSASELMDNLLYMKSKLEAFLLGWNTNNTQSNTQTSSDVSVTVNNNVNIKVTFEQVSSQIKDMSSITEKQTKEILEKIKEIELIYNDAGSKKSKWEKVKPILVWLADKSFDVGMALLPLFLKIQE